MITVSNKHINLINRALRIISIQLCLINIGFAQTQTAPLKVTMPGPAIGVAWGFSYGVDSKPEKFLPRLRNIGVNLTKIYLTWQQIEPVKGQYRWDAVDSFVKQLTSADEALIAVWSSSMWATRIASRTLPPSPAKSPETYYQFIYDLVKHCKEKIKFWQNDCEPNNPVYWNGTEEDFVNQLKIFYHAVKDADPNAKVVMGGYDGLFNPPGMPEFPGQKYGLTFFSKAIKEAAGSFDIFDLRLYRDPYTIPGRVDYFRKLLADSGRNQPVICTEYNGPGFFGFPANRKYVGQAAEWQRVISTRDTAAYYKMKNPLIAMYDSINALAPETQMFMMGSSKELNDKYDRLQGRDIVMRNILAFSAGVQKTMYWDLWHNTENNTDLMTLLFGKNKLLEIDSGRLIREYPEVAVFKRMNKFLGDFKTIKRIGLPDKPALYLFEISGGSGSTRYIAWGKRDTFCGEDEPATHCILPWQAGHVKASDIFGNNIPAIISNNSVAIDISVTPVFIEVIK